MDFCALQRPQWIVIDIFVKGGHGISAGTKENVVNKGACGSFPTV